MRIPLCEAFGFVLGGGEREFDGGKARGKGKGELTGGWREEWEVEGAGRRGGGVAFWPMWKPVGGRVGNDAVEPWERGLLSGPGEFGC